MPEPTRYPADVLVDVTARVLEGLGAPTDLARLVGGSLVGSNLVGHDSHGFIRVLEYAGWVRGGHLVPDARANLAWSDGGTAMVDGHWGWGQDAATLATAQIIENAREHGVASVVLTRGNHVGRLGEWVETMASAGLMGIAFCNTGGAVVAPYGGTKRVLGTNPYAWSMPGPDGDHLVLDFSTAVVAAGKVVLAAMSGDAVPDGALLDHEGRPTTHASDLAAGGALRAFGGHKGSGLSVLIEMAAGMLSGTLPAAITDSGYGNGTVFLALDVARFVDLDAVAAVSRQFAGLLHAAAASPDEAVLLPGEVETRTRLERAAAGIPVPSGVRSGVRDLAAELGVDLPEFHEEPVTTNGALDDQTG